MNGEKRMIGDYEVIHSTLIGARELVVGMQGEQYMCGYYVENEIMGSCTDILESPDYLEVMAIYAQRLQKQVEAAAAERKTVRIPLTPIVSEQCFPLSEYGDFVGEIAAIKLSSLRYEYRRCDRQLIYVTSGNGARENARGRAVFGINVYTGRNCGRWDRTDILGVVRPEHIPSWATERVKAIQRRLELEKRGEAR